MAYATASDVRDISDLSTTDISDAALTNLINKAARKLNSHVGVHIRMEDFGANPLNSIDGSSTEFQTRAWPLGDLDDDFDVDVSDIEVFNRSTSDVPFKKQAGVLSSIDASQGLFTFTTAPDTTKEWRINYRWFPVVSTDSRLKDANAELAAAYSFAAKNLMDITQFKIGKVETKYQIRQPEVKSFLEQYEDTLDEIRSILPACGIPMNMRAVKWDAFGAMMDEIQEVMIPRKTILKTETP